MARIWTRFRGVLVLGILAVMAGGGAFFAWSAWAASQKIILSPDIRRVAVKRADLDVNLRAGGRIESAKKTLIECEIENMRFSAGGGNSISTGNRTTIIELIPDGSQVKQDEVLCRLDSSAYEELVRQQDIRVQQARNDLLKSQLDVKAAEIALMEYRDGVLPNQTQQLDSQIVMANSDLKRQSDRLEWARRMLKNGYISGGEFANEEQKMLRVETNRKTLLGQKRVLNDYRGPITLKNLEMDLSTQRTSLAFQELRLKRMEERLDRYRRQVELCTVRAPHDGFVIYANEDDRDPRIELGAEVYQKMDLFYLPDLEQMEVEATIHETVVERVKEGMTVRVRVEALPEYELEGHVIGVGPLPYLPPKTLDLGVKSYLARIRLHGIPAGVLPGMTAEVEIQTSHAENALLVPARSVIASKGKDVCYVAKADQLERREVELGRMTREHLEIRGGLEEGEEVIEDPSSIEDEILGLAVVSDLQRDDELEMPLTE